MKKLIIIFAIAFSGAVQAQPASASGADNWLVRNRSNPDAMFWVGGNANFDSDGPGNGYGGQINARVKFGRCGIVGDWHAQKIAIENRADVTNRIGGLGATCTLVSFGRETWGFRGAHIASSLLVEYGRTRYVIYDRLAGSTSKIEIGNDTATAFGGTAGVDFYFPLVGGAWVNIGLGYEKMDFHYPLANVSGTASKVPNDLGYARLGFSYGI